MGLVQALFTVKIPLPIAATTLGIVIVVLGPETLLGSPRLNQRAIHTEMFLADQLLLVGQANHLFKQLGNDVMLQQPVAILAERGVIPDLIVDTQTNEPAIEQVIVDMFNQLPFATNTEQHLEQRSLQQ